MKFKRYGGHLRKGNILIIADVLRPGAMYEDDVGFELWCKNERIGWFKRQYEAKQVLERLHHELWALHDIIADLKKEFHLSKLSIDDFFSKQDPGDNWWGGLHRNDEDRSCI